MRGRIVLMAMLFFSTVSTVQAVDISNSQAFTYDDGNGNTLLYRLFFPPGYDTPGEEFPLVVFLHGSGQIGNDNVSQITPSIEGLVERTRSADHSAFLLVPQVQPGQGGWSAQWSPTVLAPAMDLTLQVINELEQQYQIDTGRRSLTGFSMGGFGAWDVAAKRPDTFAAVAPVAGGGDPSQAENLKDVPIWNFHGRSDSTVSVELSRNMIAAIEGVGGSPIYLEPLDTHGVSDAVYVESNVDFYDWLIKGFEPPLATVIYNPLTGNLKLDASSAPGGAISYFLLSAIEPFSLQATMTVDGNVVNTLDFTNPTSGDKFLGYKGSFADEFNGIADFGSIAPTGLSSQEIHNFLRFHTYLSPATGSESRTFRLLMEVPEPVSVVSGLVGVACLLVSRRRRC